MDSNTVFELRKEAKELNGINKVNKLNEALQISINLYELAPYDEWIQKAFAWILIDLCKYYISVNNLNQGVKHYQQLNSIEFHYPDEIIENQKSFLKPKIDTNYAEIKKSEDLSKNNMHKEAIAIFKQLILEKQLTDIHHESYGWVIYRYIKSDENELTSIQVRTFLRDYMNLNNERPSLLHSMILNFALYYSKEHLDFNLYEFFKLWNPENLRAEDKLNQWYNDKETPSLLSRIFRAFIENKYCIDIDYLVENVKIREVIDLLREPSFWKIFNARKENKISDLWGLFDNYNLQFSKFHKSKWHSEILSLAERYMQETDEWRFLDFFKEWNPNNLMDEDWEEVKKDENTYKPLAVKCLKKAYEIVKIQNNETYNTDWLIETYNIAVSKFPKDEWIKREKALLLIINKDFNQSIEIYKSLILSLGDKAYIWNEFSNCFDSNNDLKIGMLSKAIQLEKNEDFLGDIHLGLAMTLIGNELFENAIIELSTYKKHREEKGWKLSDIYYELINKTACSSTSLKNNQVLYEQFIPIAEEYAYQDINWSNFVLIDIWKNDDNKEKCKFSDGNEIEFSISKRRFKDLVKAQIGRVFEFKIHIEEIEVEVEQIFQTYNFYPYKSIKKIEKKYFPLLLKQSQKRDWSILEDEFAVVDYINTDKKVIHAITCKAEEIFFKDDVKKYNINTFIKGKRLISKRKDEKIIELKNIEIIEPSIGIEKFKKVIAIVDGVNKEKQLFHFVSDKNIQGIIRFNETKLRPNEGDFLEIWIAKKIDKKRNKVIYVPLEIKETNEHNDELIKSIQGTLELKFKSNGFTRDFYELGKDEMFVLKPDFAFISDFYVPKYILDKYAIKSNCSVSAKAIFSGDKWKIIELNFI